MVKVAPLIKWSGSKRFFLDEIKPLLPDLQGRTIFEPFVGGGSMLFCYPLHHNIFASDIIVVLIELFNEVKENPEIVYMQYATRWQAQQEDSRFYYAVRDRFNREGKNDVHDFLFLMRLCYNGLPRFNSKGEFNTSLHVNRSGILPATFRGIVFEWNVRLKNVSFVAEDYRSAIQRATSGDFIFLDPPYFSTEGQYASTGAFDFVALKSTLEELNSKNILWMLTLDANFDLKTDNLLKGVYVSKEMTSFKSSSFKRLRGQQNSVGGNTIYTNYLLNSKGVLF